MTTPTAPVIIFDDESYMYVLRDQAYAETWWEMPEEYTCGFDATARPLRMTGRPHEVRLELTGEEPDEPGLRRMVAGHYRRYLGGQLPPSATRLSEFVAGLPREGD